VIPVRGCGVGVVGSCRTGLTAGRLSHALCDTRQGLQVGGCWDVLDGSAGSSTLSGHGSRSRVESGGVEGDSRRRNCGVA
jgi:hypothetical protein